MTRNGFDDVAGNKTDAPLDESPASWTWSALPALLVSLMAAGGCSSNNAVAEKDAAAPPPDARDAVAATDTSPAMDAGPLGMIVRGSPQPCTEAHTICVGATFPATMTAQPVMLMIDLYAAVPPTRAPDGIPLMIASPHLVAGETVQLRMTDLGLTGTYHFLGLVLMPGGGDRMPVKAIDYTGDSAQTYTFTGAPLNITEMLNFQFAP